MKYMECLITFYEFMMWFTLNGDHENAYKFKKKDLKKKKHLPRVLYGIFYIVLTVELLQLYNHYYCTDEQTMCSSLVCFGFPHFIFKPRKSTVISSTNLY